MQDRHQLLLVEGSTSDAFLIVTELERAGLKVDFERVETAAYMARALAAKAWDFIIFDDHLPDFDWVAALAIYKQAGLDIPFIVVSRTLDGDPAMKRIKAGIHEQVLKDSLPRLPAAVKRELRSAQERRIRQHADTAKEFLSSTFGSSELGIVGLALDGTIISWDAGAERLYGYGASEMIGGPVSVLIPSCHSEEASPVLRGIAASKTGERVETVSRRKDGLRVGVRLVTWPVEDHAHRIIGASLLAQALSQCQSGEGLELEFLPDLAGMLPPANGAEQFRRNLQTAA
jgi:PAS domain S-box-containing protein